MGALVSVPVVSVAGTAYLLWLGFGLLTFAVSKTSSVLGQSVH